MSGPVITYYPPKSQLWGHRLGRLTGSRIAELGEKFLRERCVEAGFPRHDLSLRWRAEQFPDLAARIDELLQQLHSESDSNAIVSSDDGLQLFGRPFESTELPLVAQWLDGIAPLIKGKELFAWSQSEWTFHWRGAVSSDIYEQGGRFRILLGSRRQLSTQFHFATIADYLDVKAYLQEMGLVTLSDKYIRPQSSLTTVGKSS